MMRSFPCFSSSFRSTISDGLLYVKDSSDRDCIGCLESGSEEGRAVIEIPLDNYNGSEHSGEHSGGRRFAFAAYC